MIPAEFDYVRPHSVDEAVTALGRAGEDAKVLAGGQSLLPLLRLRLAYPTALVDLGGVGELRGVRRDGDELVIGAMTTHHEVMHDPLVAEHCPLLAQATSDGRRPGGAAPRHLRRRALARRPGRRPAGGGGRAGRDVRHRGPGRAPFGPGRASSSPTTWRRRVQPGEVLVEVRVPVLGPGWGSAYEKFNRVAQAWAIVGVAALVRTRGRHDRRGPGRADQHGPDPGAGQRHRAGAGRRRRPGTAASPGPPSWPPTAPSRRPTCPRQADYRQHLARVLTRRAVQEAVAAG